MGVVWGVASGHGILCQKVGNYVKGSLKKLILACVDKIRFLSSEVVEKGTFHHS